MVYEAEFIGNGIQNSTFFNDKNQLKKLELINMEVKPINQNELEITNTNEKYFTVPFKRRVI